MVIHKRARNANVTKGFFSFGHACGLTSKSFNQTGKDIYKCCRSKWENVTCRKCLKIHYKNLEKYGVYQGPIQVKILKSIKSY